MNSLSWLIYFAGLAPFVQGFFIFSTAILGALLLWNITVSLCGHPSHEVYGENERKIMASCKRRASFVLAPLFVLFWLLAAMVPSERTLLLIGISEGGEKVIQTEEFRKIMKKVTD